MVLRENQIYVAYFQNHFSIKKKKNYDLKLTFFNVGKGSV